jgi:hypothetical protein
VGVGCVGVKGVMMEEVLSLYLERELDPPSWFWDFWVAEAEWGKGKGEAEKAFKSLPASRQEAQYQKESARTNILPSFH